MIVLEEWKSPIYKGHTLKLVVTPTGGIKETGCRVCRNLAQLPYFGTKKTRRPSAATKSRPSRKRS